MRLTRFVTREGQTCWGKDLGDGTAEVLRGSPLAGALELSGQREAIYQRLAPVEAVNIYCVGLNYRRHAQETDRPVPQQPVIFMKPTTAVNHPGQAIRIPACCTRGPEVDYEAELAVVVGKEARDLTEENALECVLGYTCANDVSARRWQKHGGGGQWVRGKSFDTFCPLGPVLVTAEELGDPQGLAISTTVNGQVMQRNTTADMMFAVARLLAFISQDTTLLPGTVVLTGTPEGVGVARKPPVFLQAGDEVTVEIERIGRLSNPVVGPA
jgi:2-keto-4-pentenoate hydratase/2-oxohepta-3-ene-1,7-dioic acid hydratase in catechol pathway